MSAIDVAAGLIFRNGKLLLAQRHPESHLGGLWEFPGGKREPGETFAGCLRRELKEELGVDVEVQERVESVTHDYPGKRVHLEFYRCRVERGEPQALDGPAICWVSRKDLGNYQFPAADARLLERLLKSDAYWT